MAQLTQDQWAQWLLHRRFGDDAERLNAALGPLRPAREICNAKLPGRFTCGNAMQSRGRPNGAENEEYQHC